jgi:hypothetical protein
VDAGSYSSKLMRVVLCAHALRENRIKKQNAVHFMGRR